MSDHRAVTKRAPDSVKAAQVSSSLLILIAALLWSTTGIAGQLLLDTSPTTIAAVRLVLGAVVLAMTALLPGSRSANWLRRPRQIQLLVVAAGVCTASFQLSFFSAVRITGAALGTLTTLASAPVFAALFDWLFRRERPAAAWYVGTVLAVAGVSILTWSGGGQPLKIIGLLLAAFCGACYAGYSSCTGTLARRGIPLAAVVRTSLAVGAVLLVPVLVMSDLRSLANTGNVLVVAWLVVVGTVLPYLAFVGGLRHAPARTAATLGIAQPFGATVLAVLILGEPVTRQTAIAATLMIGGLIVVSWPRQRQDEPATANATA
jgi:DME family drug/metabolite transporter